MCRDSRSGSGNPVFFAEIIKICGLISIYKKLMMLPPVIGKWVVVAVFDEIIIKSLVITMLWK